MDLIERNGVLGYLTGDETFIKMTNWAPRVIGIVRDGSTLEGCRIEHAPAEVNVEERRLV